MSRSEASCALEEQVRAIELKARLAAAERDLARFNLETAELQQKASAIANAESSVSSLVPTKSEACDGSSSILSPNTADETVTAPELVADGPAAVDDLDCESKKGRSQGVGDYSFADKEAAISYMLHMEYIIPRIPRLSFSSDLRLGNSSVVR